MTPEEIAQDRAHDLAQLPTRHGETLPQLRNRFLNSYGYREALHTAYILQENVERYLLEHPSIVFDEQAYALAAHAADYLHDLYQRLGQLAFDSEQE